MLVTNWLTDSLTNWLPFSKLDWCEPGIWRWQLKPCWSCCRWETVYTIHQIFWNAHFHLIPSRPLLSLLFAHRRLQKTFPSPWSSRADIAGGLTFRRDFTSLLTNFANSLAARFLPSLPLISLLDAHQPSLKHSPLILKQQSLYCILSRPLQHCNICRCWGWE